MDFIAPGRPQVEKFLQTPSVQAMLADPSCSFRVLTPSGRYVFVSKGVEDLLGHEAKEFVHLNGFDVLHSGDISVANGARDALRNGPVEMVVRAMHKDGRPVWVQTRMMLIDGLISVAVCPTSEPPEGAYWKPTEAFL